MKKNDVLKGLEEIGLVPVVRTITHEDALAATDALITCGIPVAEVAFSVPDAPLAIKTLKEKYGDDCLVGAGAVTTPEQCWQALNAGSDFIVTSVIVMEIIAMCREEHIALLCGALTPTEVFAAWDAGADLIKIFPAIAMGGPKYIKKLSGSLHQIPLAPTGGVTPDNTEEYLRNGARFVGAGSDLVSPVMDTDGKRRIYKQAKRYLSAINDFKRRQQ